jgi:hypothetical protein
MLFGKTSLDSRSDGTRVGDVVTYAVKGGLHRIAPALLTLLFVLAACRGSYFHVGP